MTASTFSGNSASRNGGGIDSFRSLQISNSTLTANSARFGGTIFQYDQQLALTSDTISANTAMIAAGIYNLSSANAQIDLTIVAMNSSEDIVGGYTGAYNFIGGNPLLGALADNGGSTPTMALLPGSPCIDAGDPTVNPIGAFDQRGAPFARAAGERIDIGAYEVQSLLVDTDSDSSDGNHLRHNLSLREAMQLAETGYAGNLIRFDPQFFSTKRTINLSGGLPFWDANFSIEGPGAQLLTLYDNTATGTGTIFCLDAAGYSPAISGLTLSNSGTAVSVLETDVYISDCVFSGNAVGVANYPGYGKVVIDRCTFSNNGNATSASGGIYNFGSTLAVTNSTFDNNRSGLGGGAIYSVERDQYLLAFADVTNCTFNANIAPKGGAIMLDYGSFVNVDNCTIVGNVATLGVGNGGGIFNVGGYQSEVEVDDSIVALNVGGNVVGTQYTYVFHSYTGTNPMLGPLADNGGPTRTMALLTGSPCINAGDPGFTGPPDYDQRGAPYRRVSGSRIDIGAFEMQPDRWTGLGDGIHWNDSANWTSGVPRSIDDVAIDLPGTFTVLLNDRGSVHIRALMLGAAGSSPTLRLTSGGDKLLAVTSILCNGAATLDLSDNDMIVDYTGVSPLSSVQALIASARNGGTWDGPGITSSSARTTDPHITTLGTLEATDYRSVYGQTASFDGETIDTTGLLIKYTYYGDTDFDGQVTFDDYVRTDLGYNTARTGWFNGDFDLNGIIDFDDYALIDFAYNSQSSKR